MSSIVFVFFLYLFVLQWCATNRYQCHCEEKTANENGLVDCHESLRLASGLKFVTCHKNVEGMSLYVEWSRTNAGISLILSGSAFENFKVLNIVTSTHHSKGAWLFSYKSHIFPVHCRATVVQLSYTLSPNVACARVFWPPQINRRLFPTTVRQLRDSYDLGRDNRINGVVLIL